MAFGRKQVNYPTPHSIARLFDMLAGFLSIINAWMVTAAYISQSFSDIAGSIISGLVIPALLYFKSWFGKEVEGTTVKSDDVMEVRDPPKHEP